tara:strand:- start:12 stop:347 length:336 start_codon:yes stop_codon:yes gene_type:complete
MKTIENLTGSINVETGNLSFANTSTFSSTNVANITSNSWGLPERVDVIEKEDCIEFIYKEISMITLTVYPSPPPAERVFKIVFSCLEGKWNNSDRIYGEIVEKSNEYYIFE